MDTIKKILKKINNALMTIIGYALISIAALAGGLVGAITILCVVIGHVLFAIITVIAIAGSWLLED